MFVHTLLPKLQTKNDNMLEYVKNVILSEHPERNTYRSFTSAGPSHCFIPIDE